MQSRRQGIFTGLVLTMALFAAPNIFGQLDSDNFDSYATGSYIAGQGAWETWDAVPGGAGTADGLLVDTFANSAPNALELQPDDDIVRLFNGLNTGTFEFTSNVYIPQSQAADYYFILLNSYEHGGPYNWSAQIHFDVNGQTGTVTDDGGSGATTGVSTPTALIYNQWVEVRVVVDITNNLYDAFYGGIQIMDDNTWAGAGGSPQMRCLDLYNAGGGNFYYDDVVVDCPGGCTGCFPFDQLSCDIDCGTNVVDLNWSSFQLGGYNGGITINRNGAPIATLPGTATSYTDPAAPLGQVEYEVIGDCGGGTGTVSATCSVGCTGPCPPAVVGDECCDAQIVTLGPNPFDNSMMTDSIDATDSSQCAGTFFGDMGNDSWFTYTAASTSILQIDTCGSYDTDIAVYTGDCATKTQVACDGDSCVGVDSSLFLSATAGTVYTIRVGSWDAATTPPPAATLNITELCETALTGLTALVDCSNGDVDLSWDAATFDSFDINRDGIPLATALPAGTNSYSDLGLGTGAYEYEVIGNCAAFGTTLSDTTTANVTGGLGVTDVIVQGETPDDPALPTTIDSAAALMAELIAQGLSPVTIMGGPFDIPCITDPTLERVWYMGGTFPDNRALTADDGIALVTMQALGINLYVEGGDIWGFNAATSFSTIDGIADGIADGNDTFVAMDGLDSGFGLNLSDLADVPYTQDQQAPDNDWTDQLVSATTDAMGPDSALIWQLDDALGTPYGTGNYYDTFVGGKVIVQSWEIGGYGGDSNDLVGRYLSAFGVGPMGTDFNRGDCNDDGGFNIADAIYTLAALFSGGPAGTCADSCDSNDDGSINIADAIYTLAALFSGGPQPADPAPGTCGLDGTDTDALDCAVYASCP